MTGSEFLQYVLTGLSNGCVYALTGVGISLVYRATGWINLLQGEFVMLGGMIAAVLAASMAWPLAALVAIAVVVVYAVIVCDGVLRVVDARTEIHEAMVVAQFAVLGLTVVVAQLMWGTQPRSLTPFSGRTPIEIAGAFITPQQFWVVGVLAIAVVGLHLYLTRTWGGRAMRATASNLRGAQLIGVSPMSTRRRAMALAGLLGACAGVVIVPSSGMSYDSGLSFVLGGFVGAVVGGFGSIPGAVVGGVLVGQLEAFTTGLGYGQYNAAIVFGLLIVVLVVRRSRAGLDLSLRAAT